MSTEEPRRHAHIHKHRHRTNHYSGQRTTSPDAHDNVQAGLRPPLPSHAVLCLLVLSTATTSAPQTNRAPCRRASSASTCVSNQGSTSVSPTGARDYHGLRAACAQQVQHYPPGMNTAPSASVLRWGSRWRSSDLDTWTTSVSPISQRVMHIDASHNPETGEYRCHG